MATVENAGKAIASPWPEALTSMASRSATGWSGLRRETDPRQIEKELNRQMVCFEEQVKTGSSAVGGNIRFVDFAERYMVEYG